MSAPTVAEPTVDETTDPRGWWSPAASPARAGAVVIGIPGTSLRTRVQVRSVVVTLVAATLAFVVFCFALTIGDYPISFIDAVRHTIGIRTEETELIIGEFRMPRAILAVLVGASFGASGAILQRMVRNPLASPDMVGITHGAVAAAVYFIVVREASSRTVSLAALGGAMVAAVSVYLLSYRRGLSGFRLVLVGIALTAMLQAVTHYMLTRATVWSAREAMIWLTGNLAERNWDHVRPVAIALAVALPVTIALARYLRVLELGDDAARALGVPLEPVRAALLCCCVVLAAIGTTAAGPIAFVALVSPQIARRLVRDRTPAILPAAAVGALLLGLADLIARNAPGSELPVGIVTGIVGAPYLLLLLVRANRIGSGG